MKRIKPIGNKVLTQALPTEEKIGSLYIPEQAQKVSAQHTVIGLGTGKFEFKVGDKVLVSKYGGSEFKVGDQTYKLFSVDEILAVLE